MRILILIILFTNFTVSLPRHSVSTSNISIGQQFTYTVALPANATEIIDPDLSQFNIVNSTIEEDDLERRYQYELQAFTIENLIIPTLSITQLNNLPPAELAPIYLMLKSTLTPTANQLNDIAPLFRLFYVNILYVLLAVILGMIVAFVVYSKLKKKRQLMHQKSLVVDPPITIALKEIEALERSITEDQASIKLGYFKLTEIMCKFITDETSVNVLDSTTVEMKRLLKNNQRINMNYATAIIKISEKMDHYKFSKHPLLDKPSIDRTIQEAVELMKGLIK